MLIQIHLFVPHCKLWSHSWQLRRKQIVLNYYGFTEFWCACHQSYRSCLGHNGLFKSVFNDCQIAKKFAQSKTKCAYLINYGMVPFYKETLVQSAKRSPYFSFSFDESLNSAFQEEQMDCVIRFWNDSECQVKTRYLNSKFLSRPSAKKFLEKLLEALTLQGICSLIQVSIIISYHFVLWKTRFHVFSFSIKTSKLNKPTKARYGH